MENKSFVQLSTKIKIVKLEGKIDSLYCMNKFRGNPARALFSTTDLGL